MTVRYFHLSETMVGAELEPRPSEEMCASLCYRNYKIAEINLWTEQLLNLRISRLPCAARHCWKLGDYNCGEEEQAADGLARRKPSV